MLPAAARWLRERYAKDGVLDLSGVIVVTPGARAGRRLLELLLQCGGIVVPPRCVTTGGLSELLYSPSRPIAPALVASLAWSAALRTLPPRDRDRLLPAPPEIEDSAAWMSLADEPARLFDSLGADGVTAEDVVGFWKKEKEKGEEARWKSLVVLRRSFLALLETAGYSDRNEERAAAIAAERCRSEKELVLIGVVELSKAAASMLEQVASAAAVHALIAAPEAERALFDDAGRPRAESWIARRIPIEPRRLVVADRPADVAAAVIEELAKSDPLDPEGVTVCCGDATRMAPLARGLRLAGIPAHAAAGMPAGRTAPALALAALGRFAASGAIAELLSLVRHPDIAAMIARAIPGEDWLSDLEAYIASHVPARLPKKWIPDESDRPRYDVARLDAVARAVAQLMPKDKFHHLLGWTPHLRGILSTLHGAARSPESASAFEAIAAELEAWEDLPATGALAPSFTFAQAVAILQSRLARVEIPADSDEPAVEILGWLETPLDDAPRLIVTGLNEGIIPSSSASDAFLSDSLRVKLGMSGNAERHGRDAFHLATLLECRPSTLLVSLRHDGDGNPLLPSRLLFAAAAEELPARVRPFAGLEPAYRARFRLLAPGRESGFLIPHPAPPKNPITGLSVTAFRDYLACPYRFYLKHVLRLEEAEPMVGEMSDMLFGTLAHGVLEEFGRSKCRNSTDADEIGKFLRASLARTAARHFGRDAAAAVALQVELLAIRLDRLAREQAGMAVEGWMIRHVELHVKDAVMDVDGEPFGLRGRIDRIDAHPDGRVRIIDYKSGDSGRKPATSHLAGGEWIDLQLPLYSLLARHMKIDGRFEFGYVRLAKTEENSGLAVADWDAAAIEDAVEVARGVVRNIRAGVFWPPADSIGWSFGDEMEFSAASALLHEGSLARKGVIARVETLSSFVLPKCAEKSS